MAYAGGEKTEQFRIHISDKVFFCFSAAVFGVVIFALAYFTSTLLGSDWATYDMQRFYAMAQVIVNGATPYLSYQDNKPPLIYFTLAVPVLLGQKLLGGLVLVGACNFASALLVMGMGWKLYGRFAGFLAGLLFTVNIAWAQGYFVLTEPFALTFILLSTYVLFFSRSRWKYLVSGVFCGVGLGFKQYAILLIPVLLYYMYRERELRRVPEIIIGIVIPLLFIFGAVFAVYGINAGAASMYWSYGVAGSYVADDSVGSSVTSYVASNPVTLAVNIMVAVAMFTSLLVFALANFVKDRPATPRDDYFLLAAVLFAGTILIRQYLHYWILALPFIALLCARQFRDKGAIKSEVKKEEIDLSYQ
jgi:hypothetical protein